MLDRNSFSRRRATNPGKALGEGWALQRNDLKILDQFEMASIVSQDGQTMMQCSGANEEVEVANRLALGSETTAFASEDFSDRVINA
jgi:hypothetical protein